jgi:hypothetical protein
MADPVGAIPWGINEAMILARRDGGTVATTAALTALVAAQRAHGMKMIVQPSGSGSPDLWVWDSASAEGASSVILEADDAPAAGRWKKSLSEAGDVPNGSITLAKLAFDLGDVQAVAVVLDHADSSPKELLAANANVDRIVFVEAIASEAAAGGPDIDVGSATTAPTGIIEDFNLGAWVVGDRFRGLIRLPAGEALVATIAAAGTAGALNVYMQPVIIPKPVEVTIAGQDETGDTTITVTGLAVGDQLVSVVVFASGVPTHRALTDFTISANTLTIGANAANNAANKYLVTYLDKT